jgi:DNA-binding transcriptional regulator of glucitol operon
MPSRKKVVKWTRNKIVRAVLMWAGLIVLSWFNATNFDKTEYKFLAEAATMWGLLQRVLPDS